jgi:hypothetical protein
MVLKSSEEGRQGPTLVTVESIDHKTTSFGEAVPRMDVVIDTVGGDARERLQG